VPVAGIALRVVPQGLRWCKSAWCKVHQCRVIGRTGGAARPIVIGRVVLGGAGLPCIEYRQLTPLRRCRRAQLSLRPNPGRFWASCAIARSPATAASSRFDAAHLALGWCRTPWPTAESSTRGRKLLGRHHLAPAPYQNARGRARGCSAPFLRRGAGPAHVREAGGWIWA
jgi:hypothetical protein